MSWGDERILLPRPYLDAHLDLLASDVRRTMNAGGWFGESGEF